MPMNKLLIVLTGIVISLSAAADDHVYQFAPECMLSASVGETPDGLGWQVGIELIPEQASDFNNFTSAIIGQRLSVANGFGEPVGLPPTKVYAPYGATLRLAGYESEGEAESVLALLNKAGGVCGSVVSI